jgi:uncharacterized protein YoxC
MVIQICVALITLAFSALVFFLIRILLKAMVSLDETNRTLIEVRNAVHGLTGEAKVLIHTANQITYDVKGKIKTVEPLLESAQDVGEMLHNVTSTVKNAAEAIGNMMPASSTPDKKINIRLR